MQEAGSAIGDGEREKKGRETRKRSGGVFKAQ
jgi:hypothetical protein